MSEKLSNYQRMLIDDILYTDRLKVTYLISEENFDIRWGREMHQTVEVSFRTETNSTCVITKTHNNTQSGKTDALVAAVIAAMEKKYE